MTKPKGAGTVFGIILISAAAWATLVNYVLADNIWIGAALSVAGGVAIGAVVAYLMIKHFFKARKEE